MLLCDYVPRCVCVCVCVHDPSISDTLGMDLETLRAVNFLTLGESTPSGEVIKYLSLPTVWQQVCGLVWWCFPCVFTEHVRCVCGALSYC